MDTKWKSINKKSVVVYLCFWFGVTLLLAAFSTFIDCMSYHVYFNYVFQNFLIASFSMFGFAVVFLVLFFGLGGPRLLHQLNELLAEFCRPRPLPSKVLTISISLLLIGVYAYYYSGKPHCPVDLYHFLLPLAFWIIYVTVIDAAYNRCAYQEKYRAFLCVLFSKHAPSTIKKSRKTLLFACLCPFLFLGFTLLTRRNSGGEALYAAIFVVLYLFPLSALFDSIYWNWYQTIQWDTFSSNVSVILAGGPVPEMGQDDPLADLYTQVATLHSKMEEALQEQVASERTKAELITNVSHDLKTPITSLVSYIELLKCEENLSPAARDYIVVLEQKSQRLQDIVQDVFDISKAVSGQLPIEPETLDFRKLLEQTVADMSEAIEESPCPFRYDYPEADVTICTDGDRMYRVFQNLIQNALQYSLPGSRIYLSLSCQDNVATATIRNTSKDEISPATDYTARFFRGDSSRSTAGSGLGLSIAKTFTERCGGVFQIHVDGDWFTVSVTFPEYTVPLSGEQTSLS